MKKVFLVLGFIASIISLVLAVTPLFKIAFISCIAALVFGLVALFIARKKHLPKKSIHLVFLMTIIALTLSTYKTIFIKVEVGNTEELIQKENESEQDAIDTLEDIEIYE